MVLLQIFTLFFIILCSLFVFLKVLNLNEFSVLKITFGILFSCALSYCVFILRDAIPIIRFAIMIFVMWIFAGITTKTKLDIALTAIVLSIGINYGFFLILAFISALLSYSFSVSSDNFWVIFLPVTFQIICLIFLFRVKRFKKGILFLQKKGAGKIGLVISGIILFFVVLISSRDSSAVIILGGSLSAVLCIIGLILWWRHGLSSLYRKNVMERSLKEYEKTVEDKDTQIQKLIENNELLSSMIHRDNKLLPYMHKAVELFLDSYKDTDNTAVKSEGRRILTQIEELMLERTDTITQSQRTDEILPQDPPIDDVIDDTVLTVSEEGTESKERSLQQYEKIVGEKDAQIQKLIESNELLSSMIHRDNKLLPSMYEAVKLFINSCEDAKNTEVQSDSRRILTQVEEFMRERTNIIKQSQRDNKILPKTNDPLIDGIINHMMLKASEKEIEFDVTVIGDISGLTETVIPALKFQTLCADLIENAIIATALSEHKKILIIIGTNEGFYELNVQDSGIPFKIETLMRLGLEKASTHLDDGGSGIGYMTVFEILNEFKASIIITEYEPKPNGFTKSVGIRFDNKNDYIIDTFRAGDFSTSKIKRESSPTILSQST